MQEQAWHTLSADECADILDTDRKLGLSLRAAHERLNVYGANAIAKGKRFWLLRLLAVQFKSPLVWVLVLAGIATVLLGEYLDFTVISVALLVNVAVGALQEGRASKVFEALAKGQETHATVVRGGSKMVLSALDVVPGDIIEIEGGKSVPADVRLFESNNLSINEAALTGEWIPVPKDASHAPKERTPISEQRNMAWSGTSAVAGYGMGMVVATGINSALGEIARDTRAIKDDETPLQRDVRHIAKFLTIGIGSAVVAIAALGLMRGESITEVLLVSIAVAVAAIPSGLPAAVTIVLAIGMEEILRRGGLVRNLLAAETLGSTTVILTDKTGTLTEGVMSVSALYTARSIAAGVTGIEHDDNRALLEAAVLSSDAFVGHDEEGNPKVHGRPIERAVVAAGLDAGISQNDLFGSGNRRLGFVQFESERRYSASLNEHGKKRRLYLAGAPEVLMKLSHSCAAAGVAREFDADTRQMFDEVQKRESAAGHRFIGVAYIDNAPEEIPEEVEKGNPKRLVFAGLIALSDTVRRDVPAQIKCAKEAGIRVLVVTGDYAETARSVASESGVTDDDVETVTGEDIEKMNDAELIEATGRYSIFARVLPNQKLRLVRVLKSAGEIVAMTGDGVNDAPALVAADIGVAVGSGTDVAKEAADIVLLDNTFSTITAAIAQGRRIVANLRKIVAYLLSTSFSEIIVIGGALAAGAPLPLLPTQILWANLVEEGFMSFPFAFEPPDKDAMKSAPRHTSRRVVTPDIQKLIAIVTIITGAILLILFFILRSLNFPIEEIRTIIFVALSLDSIFFALSFKDLSRPLWRADLFSNKWVWAGLAGSMVLLIAAIALEPLRVLLSLEILALWEIALLAFLGFLNLLTIETTKHFLTEK